MSRAIGCMVLTGLLAALPATAMGDRDSGDSRDPRDAEAASAETDAAAVAATSGAARRLALAIEDPTLRAIVEEVLDRSPELAAAAARARAAEQRAPQVRSLPDPMLGVTGFLREPETRVGPQRATLTWSQRLPWFGKRKLPGEASLEAVTAAWSGVEARALQLVTETRRLYHEVAFLDALADEVRADRATLVRYEELARNRYATGGGLAQAVIKIQAEITRDDNRLLDVASRRAAAVAALNALRDRPQDEAVAALAVADRQQISRDAEGWRARALEDRPEIAAADAEIARAEIETRRSEKDRSPDVTVGLTYTLVGDRGDPAGRLSPPPDNGKDVLGITAGVNVPLWRKRLGSEVQETVEKEQAAREAKRAVIASIDQSLGEQGARLELLWDQVRLFEDVLAAQAGESLSSVEAAYAAGTVSVLELLDAERVLLEVRTSTARALADYAITIARLEGAVGGPIAPARP